MNRLPGHFIAALPGHFIVALPDQNALHGPRFRNVSAFAPKLPILFYVNCREDDDGRRSIDEPGLRNEFPMIRQVVYCSAKQAGELAEYKLLSPVRLTNAIYAVIEEGRTYATEGCIPREAIAQMPVNEAPKELRGNKREAIASTNAPFLTGTTLPPCAHQSAFSDRTV